MKVIWMCMIILAMLLLATAIMTFKLLEWSEEVDAELEMIGEAIRALHEDQQKLEKQQKFNEKPYAELKQRVNKLELSVNHLQRAEIQCKFDENRYDNLRERINELEIEINHISK